MDDYSRPFDPEFRLEHLSRPALARLGREIMMCAMMHDRALLPQVGGRFGASAMTDVAVDEWTGSSPIYSERNRRLLGIEGDGVDTIMKGLQLDIGAPHQFLDFQFELVSRDLGFFWLPFCGAYSYVKSLAGDNTKPIIQLCHHMEDTTFDATVMAVNPYARCTPEHRPPLEPDHAGPMCRWKISINDEHGELDEREITATIRRSRAATFELAAIERGSGGLDDYAGEFRAGFVLEELSRPALARQCREFALDLHLLVRAAYTSIAERWGDEPMREMARVHRAAMAPVYVARIRQALSIGGEGMDAILKVLQLDPAYPGEYAVTGTELVDEGHGRFWIEPCVALDDAPPRAFLELLDDAESPGFDATVASVNPRARVRPIDPASCRRAARLPAMAWEIYVDESATPWEEPELTELVRSNIIDFKLRDRAIV